jgi:hypothetical protein
VTRDVECDDPEGCAWYRRVCDFVDPRIVYFDEQTGRTVLAAPTAVTSRSTPSRSRGVSPRRS